MLWLKLDAGWSVVETLNCLQLFLEEGQLVDTKL